MRRYLIGRTAAEMVGTRCDWPRTAFRARAGPREHRDLGAYLAIVLVRDARRHHGSVNYDTSSAHSPPAASRLAPVLHALAPPLWLVSCFRLLPRSLASLRCHDFAHGAWLELLSGRCSRLPSK